MSTCININISPETTRHMQKKEMFEKEKYYAGGGGGGGMRKVWPTKAQVEPLAEKETYCMHSGLIILRLNMQKCYIL